MHCEEALPGSSCSLLCSCSVHLCLSTLLIFECCWDPLPQMRNRVRLYTLQTLPARDGWLRHCRAAPPTAPSEPVAVRPAACFLGEPVAW